MMSYMARRFVAGETMADAMKAVRILNSYNLLATLDVLGENVSKASDAEAAAMEYRSLLDEIAHQQLISNVSLKITQLGLDISSELCCRLVESILEKAAEYDNFVWLDMEGSTYTEDTLQLFHRLREEHSNVGVAIQAYLHRSEKDAQKLAEVKAPVRVCKGAYKEHPSIAFQNINDIRGNFKIVVETLLKGGSHVGIATHNEKLIRWALEWTSREKIPRDQFEFQMLYGLRRKRGRELTKAGYAVRSYVPYGTHWLPYFVRRLRERKENVFFVLKSLLTD